MGKHDVAINSLFVMDRSPGERFRHALVGYTPHRVVEWKALLDFARQGFENAANEFAAPYLARITELMKQIDYLGGLLHALGKFRGNTMSKNEMMGDVWREALRAQVAIDNCEPSVVTDYQVLMTMHDYLHPRILVERLEHVINTKATNDAKYEEMAANLMFHMTLVFWDEPTIDVIDVTDPAVARTVAKMTMGTARQFLLDIWDVPLHEVREHYLLRAESRNGR